MFWVLVETVLLSTQNIYDKTNGKKKVYIFTLNLSAPTMIAGICLMFDDCRNLFIILFIPQPKHMLWVLKRTLSMRRVF